MISRQWNRQHEAAEHEEHSDGDVARNESAQWGPLYEPAVPVCPRDKVEGMVRHHDGCGDPADGIKFVVSHHDGVVPRLCRSCDLECLAYGAAIDSAASGRVGALRPNKNRTSQAPRRWPGPSTSR